MAIGDHTHSAMGGRLLKTMDRSASYFKREDRRKTRSL